MQQYAVSLFLCKSTWTCREINSLHIVASVGHSIEYYDARNNKYKIEYTQISNKNIWDLRWTRTYTSWMWRRVCWSKFADNAKKLNGLHFQVRKLILTSTRRQIPQHIIVTNTPVPQFKLARFSCNYSQSVLKTTTEWSWDVRQNLFQLHSCLFTIECYLLIFPYKFKFRFRSEAMEFKCSLLLNSDSSLYS